MANGQKLSKPPAQKVLTKGEVQDFIRDVRLDHLLSFSAEYSLETGGWVCAHCEHVNCPECDDCAHCGKCRAC